MTDHFALVPPESPVLNGGDWLDLGTMESDDREPQPSDGPDYHADHDAWVRRRSGRVPVVPTWTCPTCGGSGTSGPEFVDEFGASPCLDCEGEGVVSQGWLALGAAGHFTSVPASLSELVRVQRWRVVHVDDIDHHIIPFVLVWDDGAVEVWEQPEDGLPITDQFTVPPNPGGWAWRIVERVTLSDPITGWACPECEGDGCEHGCVRWFGSCEYAYAGPDSHRIHAKCKGKGSVPLPQQVGWYQADDALVAEIERRRR